jgi:hypothetical protein
MRKLLLAGVAASLLFADMTKPAMAIDAVYDIPTRVASYSAAIVGLVPAASATDFFTITGSATMVVRIKVMSCSGVSTASGTSMVQGVVRSTANATGTSTSPTVVPNDSNDVAGTAVVRAYTVNPGTLGTAIGTVRIGAIGTSVAATAAAAGAMTWDFGSRNDKEVILRGTGMVFAMNANATSFQAGSVLSCYAEWTESSN